MITLKKAISHSIGAVTGIVTGFISGFFLGPWYTFQSTETLRWNLRSVLSSLSFPLRLIINCISFPILSLVAGCYHGIFSGFLAACSWPTKFLNIINRPELRANFLSNIFSTVPTPTAIMQDPPPLSGPSQAVSLITHATSALNKPLALTNDLAREIDALEEKQPNCQDKTLPLNEHAVKGWTEQNFRDLNVKLNLGRIDSLNLCNNDLSLLTSECIRALMKSISASKVTKLYLNFTNLGKWCKDKLTAFTAEFPYETLRELHLSDNNLGGWSVELFTVLIDALARSQIQTLSLGSNNLAAFTQQILEPILVKLNDSKIQILYLDNNHLGGWNLSIKEFTTFILALKMESIYFAHNGLQNESRQWSDKAIKNFVLEIGHKRLFDIRANNFSQSQLNIFNTSKDIKPIIHAFFMGSKKTTHKEEKEPAISQSFFNHPLGGNSAKDLAKIIFKEFVPEIRFE